LPTGGREYVRGETEAEGETDTSGRQIVVDSPVPELFAQQADTPAKTKKAKRTPASTDATEKPPLRKTIFAKMKGKRD
jgi:hypothetical protein